jgi:hypothetical protein
VKVAKVKMVMGDNDHVDKYLHDPQSAYLQFDLVADDKTEWSEHQKLKLDDEGKIRYWYSPRWTAPDGKEVGNSLATDILLKAEAFDPKQREAVKGMSLEREKFEGLKFNLQIREYVADDGEPRVVGRWDRQVVYEELMAAEKAKEDQQDKKIEQSAKAQATDTELDEAFEEQKAVADTSTPVGTASEAPEENDIW